MTSINIAALINLLGFTTGAALYAMLLVMVFRQSAHPAQAADSIRASLSGWTANGLLFATAILGLLWNLGALSTYGLRGFGINRSFPLVLAISYTALGFLPAVVVHSVLQSGERSAENFGGRWITLAAYSLSAVAGCLHFYDAVVMDGGPSLWGLRALTVGYLILIGVLFLTSRRRQGWQRAVGASALAVFAVSALHLSHHHDGEASSWLRELTGHQASLPLVLAILYQDYRFALADIFLKRALALLVLVALAFGLYVTAAAPLLASRSDQLQPEPRAVGVLLGLWVATALLYPLVRRLVVLFVDKIVLRRADYGELRAGVAGLLAAQENSALILDEVCKVLAPALSAREVRWLRTDAAEWAEKVAFLSPQSSQGQTAHGSSDQTADLNSETVAIFSQAPHDENVVLPDRSTTSSAIVFIPTAEPPFYALLVGTLTGGRRLLSDDIAMLDSVAIMVARRIDGLRVTHERCEQDLREQEMSKLTTEAQLRALRAQVNPHFLFNALTTIGYLVQTSPDRALETLIKLTNLLRGVLRTNGEFVTLDEELKLIASYLDIERARFEERLRVCVDVPPELLDVRLPSLLIQPLVENAIKHGIAPSRFGGEVSISARLETSSANGDGDSDELLRIMVSDTGVGASEIELARGRRRGVGLSNVEERLRCYSGEAASLRITSAPGAGTTVEIRMPIPIAITPQVETIGTPSRALSERRGA